MTKPNTISHAAAILPVNDMQIMLHFYTTVVGCKIESSWESPPSYVVLSLGNNIQWHLSKSDNSEIREKRRPFAYVYVRDTDDMYNTLNNNGAKNITQPNNAEYNMRDFELIDPENNVIVFGKATD